MFSFLREICKAGVQRFSRVCDSVRRHLQAAMNYGRIANTVLRMLAVITVFIIVGCHGAKPQTTALIKQTRETNPFNFFRLLIMRIIYGIATMVGFEDDLSEVANGAFVPPGIDEDYGGFDLDGRESDYSYDDY